VPGDPLKVRGRAALRFPWRKSRADTAKPGDIGVERVRSGAQQLPALEVEEAQPCRVDADADLSDAEDFSGEHKVLTSETLPNRLTMRSTSITSSGCGTGMGGGPAGRPGAPAR
jgi:hypothetical protein